ncbi:DNA polymerase-3 subunit gamma/tau [Isoptericola jiangsuensis]|uniref:DNA-directed DNA polymerase n=1 Tax=Isoptericola jiangsuensis TaxID=548579 RepID=A0A2A9F043_9MICO|nr:DNA polymerase III subunit gamma and tau [Isoptericola jiangsuensis]PFG44508.1 DNA polymerase-3 subunit gamma/tau [Isoptericola jiangsuensis]
MTTALYRRYRPETFAEVIGQEHVTAPLMQALRTGRVNHAYLFSGPRGCGKTTSARILARTLNCHANTPEQPVDTPCGVCPSCVELARGGSGSLDVVEIDAASHGGVDDARDLRERATFAPTRDRFKIFVIDEAHMVSPAGFNALLKIVEEPPPHIKFVFATTEPDKVIGTIRSRTHHYPFRLLPPDVLGPYLEQLCAAEGVELGAGVTPLVTRAGGGSARDTLSVLDQLIAGATGKVVEYDTAVGLLGFTHATLLDDVVDAIAARDGGSIFRVVDHVVATGHEPRRFVEDVLERLRDLIVIAVSGDAAAAVLRDLPADQLDRMRHQAANLGVAELSRAADLVNDALTEMAGATSPRLHLELLCARLLLPGADDGTQGLAARLDRLERGAVAAGPVAPAGQAPAAGAAPDRPTAPAPVPGPVPDAAPVATVVAGGLSGAAAARAALQASRRSTSSAGSAGDAPAPAAPASSAPAASAPAASAPAVPAAPDTSAESASDAGPTPAVEDASPAAADREVERETAAPGSGAPAGSPAPPDAAGTAAGTPARGAGPAAGPAAAPTGAEQPAAHPGDVAAVDGPGSSPAVPDEGSVGASATEAADATASPAAGTTDATPALADGPEHAEGTGSTSQPDTPMPAPTPAPAQPQPVATVPAPAAPAAGGMTAEEVRRRWDEVVANLSSPVTRALVDQNAQVASLAGDRLLLAFQTDGLARNFAQPRHLDAFGDALYQTLGLRVQLDVTVGAPGPEAAPQAVRPASAPVDRPGRADATRSDATRTDAPRQGAPAARESRTAAEVPPGDDPGDADPWPDVPPPDDDTEHLPADAGAPPVPAHGADPAPAGGSPAGPAAARTTDPDRPAQEGAASARGAGSAAAFAGGASAARSDVGARSTASQPDAGARSAAAAADAAWLAGTPAHPTRAPEPAPTGRPSGPGGGAPASAPTASAPTASGPSASASSAPSAPAGGSAASGAPAGRAASGGATAAARAAVRPTASAPERPAPQRAAEPSAPDAGYPDGYDDMSDDDPDIASTGLVGVPLVVKMLDGTVIDEVVDQP